MTATDFTSVLSEPLSVRIFRYVDLRTRCTAETACKRWRRLILDSYTEDTSAVWLYIIFRSNGVSGHDSMSVRVSSDGPIFWTNPMIYVYLCACHFSIRHETELRGLIQRIAHRIERICLVNSPIDGPFLTNGFYEFLFSKLTNVNLIYMRQLNLRNLNAPTVRALARKATLKKVIAHDCESLETLSQENELKSMLMCFTGQIKGLQFLLEGLDALPADLD